jgi:choline dehydrogenase/5-(hydroxymethyl)furfural/furfural oxidase
VTRADVVIVGGGSAGSVIAGRLSERPDRQVLVLEAGPATWDARLDNRSFFDALSLPGRVWPAVTASRAAGAAPSLYVRGRGIGGSSSVNAMVGLPPSMADLDRWAAAGGWGRDLAGVETRLPLAPPGDDEIGPLAKAILGADADAIRAPLTRFPDRRRGGSYAAYLEPVLDRANLAVMGDALVDRVVLDGDRAVGVVLAGGREIEAGAVIVSAGAIHSPAVLLRSGIATPGIGEGLQDHPSSPIEVLVAGEWSGCLPISVIVVFRCGDDVLQLLPLEGLGGGAGRLMAAVMTVRSTGAVRLVSDDPAVDPEVHFDMLSDSRDQYLMDVALDRAEAVLAAPGVREMVEVTRLDRSAASVRAGLGDYVHAAGSCAMGRVVDQRCAVVGYESLFVCDTSVMPCVPSVNTYLPVVMLAERFAAGWLAPASPRSASPRPSSPSPSSSRPSSSGPSL